MRTKSTTYLRRSRPAGLTLLEVVAAIAILGTILVGIVLARSRHVRQLARSERQGDAVRATDEQLARWWTRPEGVPVDASGAIETDGSLTWQTHVVPSEPLEQLGARVVRVEVRPTATDPSSPTGADAEPLVTVDLVLPDPDREEPTPTDRPTDEPQSPLQEGGRP